MICNHGKRYSSKIQNILCDPVTLAFTGYLFPQNSFKEGLARTNDIVIYLRKGLVAKVYLSIKKTLESCILDKSLENSPGEHIIAQK